MRHSGGRTARLIAGACAAGLIASGGVQNTQADSPAGALHSANYALTAAFSPLPTPPSTVLTLEGGLVGLQNLIRFTPTQLRGDLCKSPNTCRPVDYPALPGDNYNDEGARRVDSAISSLPPEEDVVLFGHSQGGQVIYSALREWKEDPASAPEPSRVNWVSIGNPENRYGGVTSWFGFARPQPRVPTDTEYAGTEVIYQYDGWADFPDNPFNLLALVNAIIGSQIYHPVKYMGVDLNSPDNVTYTPTLSNGSPGNITYVWVPAQTIPLVSGMGIFAPALDRLLRPCIEAGYRRPVNIPNPNMPKQPPAGQVTAGPAPVRSSVGIFPASRPTGSSQSTGAPLNLSAPRPGAAASTAEAEAPSTAPAPAPAEAPPPTESGTPSAASSSSTAAAESASPEPPLTAEFRSPRRNGRERAAVPSRTPTPRGARTAADSPAVRPAAARPTVTTVGIPSSGVAPEAGTVPGGPTGPEKAADPGAVSDDTSKTAPAQSNRGHRG